MYAERRGVTTKRRIRTTPMLRTVEWQMGTEIAVAASQSGYSVASASTSSLVRHVVGVCRVNAFITESRTG